MSVSYPPPPWQTHGYGFFASYRVPADTLSLPKGFRAQTVAGHCLGLLGFIEYQPPSPLCYRELLWMPAQVSAHGMSGHYVAKMYVDDERSLVAGRTEWALPKTLAQFSVEGSHISMRADDGSVVELDARGYGPRIPMPKRLARMATLQAEDGSPDSGSVVRFRCSFAGSVQLARLRLIRLSPGDSDWRSLERARRLPFAASLRDFDATMQPAERNDR